MSVLLFLRAVTPQVEQFHIPEELPQGGAEAFRRRDGTLAKEIRAQGGIREASPERRNQTAHQPAKTLSKRQSVHHAAARDRTAHQPAHILGARNHQQKSLVVAREALLAAVFNH